MTFDKHKGRVIMQPLCALDIYGRDTVHTMAVRILFISLVMTQHISSYMVVVIHIRLWCCSLGNWGM